MQTVLLDGLGTARSARLHRRVGEALVATDGNDAEIARHLLAAACDGSDPEPGVRVALRAAGEAVERYTYDDAISLLTVARDALHADASADRRLACEVEITLARALRNAGIYDDRDEVLERAWNHASEVNDFDLLADVVVEALAGTTTAPPLWSTRVEEIVDSLADGSRAQLLVAAVRSHILASQPGERARDIAEWTVARSEAFGPGERCVVLIHATYALNASTPIERVLDLARAACEAARQAGAAADLVVTLSALRLAYLATGDLGRSDDVAREYEELVRAVRIPRYVAGVEQRRAMRALLAGRFAEAEAHAQQAVATQPTDEYFEGLAVQLFAICFEQQRLEEIRPAIEAWAAHYDRPAWTIGYATLLAEIGEDDDALDLLAPFLDRGLRETVAADDLFFLSVAAAATAVVRIGDRARGYAPALYDLLAPHASRVIVAAQGALCWGSLHRVLGPLAALIERPELAAVHFEAAMAVHERLGARPFLARDRLGYAAMLRATGGDNLRVEQLERTGRALARELGMRALSA